MASVPCPSASGAQVKDQDARDQTPHSRHEQDQPPGPGITDRMGMTLERGRHLKMEQAAEHVSVHELKAEQECHCPQAGDEPDDGAAKCGPSDSRRCPRGRRATESPALVMP